MFIIIYSAVPREITIKNCLHLSSIQWFGFICSQSSSYILSVHRPSSPADLISIHSPPVCVLLESGGGTSGGYGSQIIPTLLWDSSLLLTKRPSGPVWPKCVCVCVSVFAFACQDANKGMRDVPYECCPGTSPPLLFVPSGSSFGLTSALLMESAICCFHLLPFLLFESLQVDIFLFILWFSFPQKTKDAELVVFPACFVNKEERHKGGTAPAWAETFQLVFQKWCGQKQYNLIVHSL